MNNNLNPLKTKIFGVSYKNEKGETENMNAYFTDLFTAIQVVKELNTRDVSKVHQLFTTSLNDLQSKSSGTFALYSTALEFLNTLDTQNLDANEM